MNNTIILLGTDLEDYVPPSLFFPFNLASDYKPVYKYGGKTVLKDIISSGADR